VTGLVMTAALLGFAVAGLLGEGDPERTLRRAMWLTAASSLVAALSPLLVVLLVARATQGIGTGMLVAGGLAEVPRRLPATATGRVTAAMISGTAFGGLAGRVAGYTGIFVTWRGAFVIGGVILLASVGFSLRALTRFAERAQQPRRAPAGGRAPLSIILAGLFILFVNVAVFDLLPYRLAAAPFHLSEAVGDLIYLVFLVAVAFAWGAGWAIDRFGPRAVIVVVALFGIVSLLATLLDSLPLIVAGAAGSICATVGLHAAHSGWAARYGRSAVGRYLTMYYVGGAVSAPLCAYTFQRWGWPGVIAPLVAVWLVLLLLAVARQQPDRPQGQQPHLDVTPAGSPG
jgi:YNFM family putative membrane transporter